MTKQLAKSTGAFGGATLVSRILGLARDNIAAIVFGTTFGYDAFLVAFKIPNFMRRLFAEGAFSQAFVPLLSGLSAKEDQAEIQNFIDNLAGAFSLVLMAVSVIGIVIAPLIIMLFAPGFGVDSARSELAVSLLRITFPYLLFISLAAFVGSILNTFGKFAVPAITPVFLNIAMIMGAVWFAPLFEQPIYGLAWGVFLGGLLQLLFQLPFLLKLGYFPRPKWGFSDPHVRRLLKLMVPALLGVSVAQLNLLIDTIFASYLKIGSISWLYYADRLVEFPLGIFGVALATVVLPHLSRHHIQQATREFSSTLDWALRSILLIGFPSTIGLFILAEPMVTTLFNYGKFSSTDVLATAPALQAMAVGLIPFMAIKVLASGFYAQQDIRTPVRIAIGTMILNVILNAILMQYFFHVGLAASTTIAAIVNMMILGSILIKRKRYIPHSQWGMFFMRLGIVNGLMLASLLWLIPTSDSWLAWSALERIMHLLWIIGISGAVYLIGLRMVGFRYHELLSPVSVKVVEA